MTVWNSTDPWGMADVISASQMPLDADQARLVRRAHEGGHTWSVYQLHELNVLCFEARGWRAARVDTLRRMFVAAACASAFYYLRWCMIAMTHPRSKDFALLIEMRRLDAVTALHGLAALGERDAHIYLRDYP